MFYVPVGDTSRKLDLNSYDSPVVLLDDEIDFVASPLRPEVPDASLDLLCVAPKGEGHQRLEEMPEQRAISRDGRPHLSPVEQCAHSGSKQASSQRRVCELVLWRFRQAREAIVRGLPRGNTIENPKPLQDVAIGSSR